MDLDVDLVRARASWIYGRFVDRDPAAGAKMGKYIFGLQRDLS